MIAYQKVVSCHLDAAAAVNVADVAFEAVGVTAAAYAAVAVISLYAAVVAAAVDVSPCYAYALLEEDTEGPLD